MKQKLKKQETGFTQIKNSVLEDKNLSLVAKGLWCYLYSKPDDWDFSHKRISLKMKESHNTISKYLKELENLGYLERQRLSTGRMNYYINFEPHTKIAKVANSQGGNSGTVSNTEFNSNKEVNNFVEQSSTRDKKEDKDIKMNIKEFKEHCYKSKQPHIRFIADWALAVKQVNSEYSNCDNKAEWNEYIKRNVRASKKVLTFSEDKIKKSFKQIKIDSEGFTKFSPALETLIKYLTK